MEMIINDTRTIRDIQREFNTAFPFLKLECFSIPYKARTPSPKAKLYSEDRQLGYCRTKHNPGVIRLTEDLTVAELEMTFWENFGLNLQVFRKSGPLWIETSYTDGWTLKRQNDEGHELSLAKNNIRSGEPEEDPLDRDIFE